jgi:site-specific recombinase XerD
MPDKRPATQLPLFPAGGERQTAYSAVVPLPQPAPSSSLTAAAGAFDQHLARLGKTVNTRRAFASDLRILGRWLGPDRRLDLITTDDLQQFLTWLLEGRATRCSDKSYGRRVTTVKVFFAWLAESRVLSTDPALALVHRYAEPPLPLVLTDPQVADLLWVAERHRGDDARPALVVRLLLDTGLKKGELVALDVADMAPEAEPPSLLVRYDAPRWRQKERRVTFSPAVPPLLDAYQVRYRPAARLFPCTARNLEYVLGDLVSAAGLPDGTSFETLRWTSALRAQRAGLAPDELRLRLGLSPITWADTERKLALLSGGVAVSSAPVGLFFAAPGD